MIVNNRKVKRRPGRLGCFIKKIWYLTAYLAIGQALLIFAITFFGIVIF